MNIRELAEHYTEVKDFLYDIMLDLELCDKCKKKFKEEMNKF